VIVIKFGGTSVGDADAIQRACAIVQARMEKMPVVVVSALSGTTTDLLELADLAASGNLISALSRVEAQRARHIAVARVAAGADSAGATRELEEEISALFDEVASLAEALSVLGHLTPRSLDAIASMGERASVPIVVAAMQRAGMPAQIVDARLVMITDEAYTRAQPLPDLIAESARTHVLPLVREGRIPVMGGYIGGTQNGVTTTLGRGGSDFSAALFGAAMQAEAIEIWTDVDGMLTADPRVVKGSLLIPQIRFDEASELAYFGAKVLHPSTIAPAVQKGIPVFIFNSRRPEGNGTRITFDAPRRAVSAIAGKQGIAVVRVRSPQMLLAHGFLKRVFEIFERHRISVDVVATSEISISVTIDESPLLEALVPDLMELGDVSIERNRGIIALVGGGLSDDSAAMARALTALDGTRVHMLSLSATGINLTMIVDSSEIQPAMQRLHSAFFGDGIAGAAGGEVQR
jgi:aspartate kinase